MEIIYLDEMPAAVDVLAPAFWSEWGRHDGLTLADVTGRVTACLQHDELPLALVAREGDAVLGTVGLRWDTVVSHPVPGPWLAALWVHPDHRRRGLGAQLIAAAERSAATRDIAELYAATSSAARLFREAGWTELEPFEHAGDRLTLFHWQSPRHRTPSHPGTMADFPLACSLTDPDLRARRGGILAELQRRSVERKALPDGLALRFAPRPGLVAFLAEVIELERQCCRFLRIELTVTPDDGPLWLRLTGPVGTPDFLAAELGLAGREKT